MRTKIVWALCAAAIWMTVVRPKTKTAAADKAVVVDMLRQAAGYWWAASARGDSRAADKWDAAIRELIHSPHLTAKEMFGHVAAHRRHAQQEGDIIATDFWSGMVDEILDAT